MVNILQKRKIMSENYVVENLIGGNNFFEIPEYQRAYSWEEAQWAQFIDDMLSANRFAHIAIRL